LSRKKFPPEEKYVLTPQFWRAMDSIVLNIAEGTEKYSDKDFGHFLNIAIGSVSECVACLDCASDDGYITKNDLDEGFHAAEEITRQLKAFSAKLRSNQKSRV
jgi:four helix bundle protein